jgi:hypothetical protein
MDRTNLRSEDDPLLRECIEKITSERFDSRNELTAMVRKPYRHIGSYDCEIVTASLSNGETLDVFFKDFRFTQQPKDERKRRRDREVFTYQHLLADAGLGTAECYGSLWGEQGRYWLFLEYVRGQAIQSPSGEHAALAGDWLARMQDRFREQIPHLARGDLLIAMDDAFFRDRALRAVRDTSRIAPVAEKRLRSLVQRYDPAIELLARQPRTLVHGGYIPWHILVDESREPTRLCAIDWELAAIGPSLYDLALFTDDASPPEEARILGRYCDSARSLALPLPDEFEHVIGCIRLHRVFDWLSRAVEKGFSERKVVRLVERAERISKRILYPARSQPAKAVDDHG